MGSVLSDVKISKRLESKIKNLLSKISYNCPVCAKSRREVKAVKSARNEPYRRNDRAIWVKGWHLTLDAI